MVRVLGQMLPTLKSQVKVTKKGPHLAKFALHIAHGLYASAMQCKWHVATWRFYLFYHSVVHSGPTLNLGPDNLFLSREPIFRQACKK